MQRRAGLKRSSAQWDSLGARRLKTERVVIFTDFYAPAFRGGGPIRTLEALVRAAPAWSNPVVVTSDRDLGVPAPFNVQRNAWTFRDGVPCYYASTRSLLCLLILWRSIQQKRPTTLYFNSFFSVKFTILPLLLRAIGWCRGSRILLAPRGELSPGALSIKPKKKQVYISTFRRTGLSKRITWHASTTEEATQIRRTFGADVTIVIRENETLLPKDAIPISSAGSGPLRVAFLSRISPKKGLDILIRALAVTHKSILLDVYGAIDDASYERICRNLATEAASGTVVNFRGPVQNTAVRGLLHQYELFAFPTAGENFGHVIVEALSASCPVMCSDQTPWTEQLQQGGGVVVAARTPTAWAEAIDLYASLTPEERLRRRRMAGATYAKWASRPVDEHVFHKLRQISPAGNSIRTNSQDKVA